MQQIHISETTAWLLEGPPWVQYRTRLDLLGQTEDDPQVQAARQAMLDHPQVQALLAELAAWPGTVLSSHKSAGQHYHKLAFLADLGLRADDPGMAAIIAHVVEHQSAQGPFQLPMNIPIHFGGSGQDEWAWALCDAPVTLYALAKFGLGHDPRVQQAVDYLAGLVRANGWPCAVSPELGRFRGPGRKDDPCPYANLVMLKALQVPGLRSQVPGHELQSTGHEWQVLEAARTGAETLLTLWTQSREQHPYMFYMGTDFRKLKAPFIWYDILHVLEVLSQFPWLRSDPRLQDMANVVRGKADAQGRFTPESVWQAWGEWDFGQKKAPSRWLTLLATRMLEHRWWCAVIRDEGNRPSDGRTHN